MSDYIITDDIRDFFILTKDTAQDFEVIERANEVMHRYCKRAQAVFGRVNIDGIHSLIEGEMLGMPDHEIPKAW